MIAYGAVAMLTAYPPTQGYIKVSDAVAGKTVPCETLYGSYREWCSRKGRTDLRSETFVRLAVKSVEKVEVKRIRLMGKKIDAYFNLPEAKKTEVIKLPKEKGGAVEIKEGTGC